MTRSRAAGGLASAAPRTALAALLVGEATAIQGEWFEITQFRGPGQCERMSCLSVRTDNCREYLEGFYLREKGCPSGQACTNCGYGNMTTPSMCYCENPPYAVKVTYNEACGLGKDCTEGQCYRPCYTFLQVTACPTDYCVWDSYNKTCLNKPAAAAEVAWVVAQDGPARPILQEGQDVILMTAKSNYPLSFDVFRANALGFRISGILLDDLISLTSLFLELDTDVNGLLDATEFANLPQALGKIEEQALRTVANITAAGAAAEVAMRRRLGEVIDEEGRRLQNATITPERCSSQRPRAYYCSFDVSCKEDCRECGWKTATDTAFATCVLPTPESCWADGFQVFCDSDQLCHPPGDCSNCVDRPIVDHSQHKCLQVWWGTEPLTTMKDWVCRHRSKNGMPCIHDQDCVHGLKRCFGGKCAPFQPYNPNVTCTGDLDCPHIGYYCPPDPTGGENKFWVQYCREQGGEMMTCRADRECKPDMRCNTAEPQPRCRRLFSLPIGFIASDDTLCEHGWRDRSMKCAPPAKSKKLGQPCDTHEDCETTDATGRPGECVCKPWWETSDPKVCEPVTGDYSNHQEKLRNYLFFRAKNCGNFWSEDECLRVFGIQALRMKLELQCEKQRLSGGPFLPDAECAIDDPERFPDYCAQLAALR